MRFVTVSQWIMVLVVAFSALNILPLIVIPVSAAILVGMVGVAQLIAEKRVKDLFEGPRKYFIVFVILNISYAWLIGVNILDPHLYRHEFKYFVSFAVFIFLSILPYSKSTEKIVFTTLIAVAGFSFLWFIFSLVDWNFYSLYLYPYLGVIWEHYPIENIYLGPYQSHNSAGGFYTFLLLMFLAILQTDMAHNRSKIVFGALCVTIVCIFFTGSRSYMLALGVLTIPMMGFLLYDRQNRRIHFSNARGLYFWGLALVFVAAVIGTLKMRTFQAPSFMVAKYRHQVTIQNGRVKEFEYLRQNSVNVRVFLWKRAFDDFIQSPIIGVGASRFDSDKDVINSEPRITLHEVSPELLDLSHIKIDYLKGFLYRINVSKTNIHLEQEPHNAYFQVLAEGGLVMFSIFVAMYFTLARKLHSLTTERRRESDLFVGLATGTRNALLCLCVSSFFGSHLLGIIPLAAILALSAYLISYSKSAELEPPCGLPSASNARIST